MYLAHIVRAGFIDGVTVMTLDDAVHFCFFLCRSLLFGFPSRVKTNRPTS